MRATFLFLWLAISTSCYSQNYVLDPTFGGTGVVVKNLSFFPKDVALYNDSYYLISNDKAIKVLYDGDTDTTFGVDGIVSLDNNGVLHGISGFKIIEGYMYVYGKTNPNETNNDGFLAKISIDSGVLDTAFGTNGISYIDFSGDESIDDFVYLPDGGFYCVGTRSQTLIYFKIDNGGVLDTAFDTALGYKEILLNQKSYGNAIKSYNGNFLLVGTDYLYNGTIYQKLLLSMVDINGNLVSSFGNNGTTTTELNDGTIITINKINVNDSTLYVDFTFIWSFYHGGMTLKYDLDANMPLYNNLWLYYSRSEPDDDKLYTTGWDYCMGGGGPCSRSFQIKRSLADGTLDTSFNQMGTYTYNFGSFSDNISTAFSRGTDGSILVVGAGGTSLKMIRIVDATSLTETEKNIVKNTITPNPFKDHITVKASQAPNSAEVYDFTGRLVANPTVNYNNGSTELKLDNITQCGIYLLKLDFGNKTETHKIIKQ
ncbi:T9SS type A sorting domain-containing protein [Flavobacterium sp. RHBU_3]|uniref:T9SS type A sorting domain-containing protein n=1 Tax=Flavobacterium sp. RHBU_3 TaxID=3391184 RepID=UPI003985662A